MKSNKYKLVSGVTVTLSLFFFFSIRHMSYSANIVVISILLIIATVMLVTLILGRKKLKSKWLLPGMICMILCGVLVFLGYYLQHNNMGGRDIIGLLMPVALYGFIQVGYRFKLSTMKDKREIKAEKKKITFFTVGIVAYELAILYPIFILHR